MKAKFKIGDVFSPDDPVARFVAGVAMVVNDLTLANENASREFGRPGGERSGISLHFMYAFAAHYREGVKFLTDALRNDDVGRFVDQLPAPAQEDLQALTASCTPWDGSFVEQKLKPVRDAVFHYVDWKKPRLREALEAAGAVESAMDLGETGTYAETRYDFADEILRAASVRDWGISEEELASVLERLGSLVLAFTRFGHAVVAEFLRPYLPGAIRVVDR